VRFVSAKPSWLIDFAAFVPAKPSWRRTMPVKNQAE
jgi:hypothetical protein